MRKIIGKTVEITRNMMASIAYIWHVIFIKIVQGSIIIHYKIWRCIILWFTKSKQFSWD